MTGWMIQIKEALSGPLPGADAQHLMSPVHRRPITSDLPLRKGAVLILLYEHLGKVHTVFIRRTEYHGVHSGQISFPGGMHEREDASLAHTALRETMEETGIATTAVSIIGALTPLHIPVSNIEVHPYVAVCRQQPDFNHDPSEVQYLIACAMDVLRDPANRKSRVMSIAGHETEVPFYLVQGHEVWGATAMILSEFLAIMESIW